MLDVTFNIKEDTSCAKISQVETMYSALYCNVYLTIFITVLQQDAQQDVQQLFAVSCSLVLSES